MSADLSNLTVGEFLHTLRQVVADLAQQEQDEGHTWGEALKCAEAEADARAFT